MMANTFSTEVRSNEIRSAPHDYRDSGFEVFNNPPSMWPSFLVGQRDSPIRALVIDDDIHFVNVLQQELSQDERIQVVGKANSLKEGKRLCRSASFDVLLFDINLADGSGYQLLELLQTHRPTVQSIVCTVSDQDDLVSRAFDLGASGYLLKHSWFGNSTQSVLQVANGGAAVTPQLAKRLLRRFDPASARHAANLQPLPITPAEQLSTREKDILRMVASGFTSTDIAARLSISHMTVNTHIRNTYRKLQVRSRAQAVQSAMVRGLI